MVSTLRFASFVAIGAFALPAQCAPSWLPGSAVSGTNAPVLSSVMWDRDGSGPLPPLLVVGGSFTAAGSVAAGRIATWDPITGAFAALGTGLNGDVRALAVLPNGDLVAGGDFTVAGGVGALRVARWNGAVWSALGAGFDAPVWVLHVTPTGALVAGGEFLQSGSQPRQFCAQWNGASWLAMPGLTGTVEALTTLPNGTLVGGGPGLFQWTGFNWQALGSGFVGSVSALQLLPNGDLFVGGDLSVQNVPTNVARWDGSTWTALPAPGGLPVFVFGVLPNGNLAAASRQFPLISVGDLSVFDGVNWTNVPDPTAWIVTMTRLPGGDLFLGGAFLSVPGLSVANVARWDGASWQGLVLGTNNRVRQIVSARNGDLLVAGDFATLAGTAAAGVARRTATGWTALGQSPGGQIRAVIELDNGDIVVGGMFAQPPSPAAAHIARWNGTTWSAMGTGLDWEVRALLRLANGDLVAGGLFPTAGGQPMPGIARWDGVAWQPIGDPTAGWPGNVSAMAQLPNGDLVVGRFGGSPLLWDGVAWSDLGLLQWSSTSIQTIETLLVRRDGSLLAGGQPPFVQTPYSALGLWDGSSWSSAGLTLGSITSLLELPDADVLVGGDFTNIGNQAIARLVRWNGTAFQSFAGGASASVRAMHLAGNGSLWIGGDFQQVGTTASAYLAQATSGCAALAVPFGVGCVGSGGQNQLQAVALPWLGSRYRSRATGMPGNGFVLRMLSTAVFPAQPLGLGGPGCQQLVAGDVLELQLPVAGVCDFELPVPDSATLIGFAFREQVVPFEFASNGALQVLTSSNALTMTVGNF